MGAEAKTAETASLENRLQNARLVTDKVFETVRSAAMYERPIAERHRLIFYLGHLEAFDWNLFRQQSTELKSFHPAFDQLFAFGIDPVDGGLPKDQPEDWPSIGEIQKYNQRTRQTIDAYLETQGYGGKAVSGVAIETLLHVAVEHRLMHAETLAYLHHRMPYAQKVPQHQPAMDARPRKREMVKVPAGRITLGRSRSEGRFGWDNEFAAHRVDVPEFRIDKFMVTNGEFLEFAEGGGYDNRTLWKEADWRWIETQQIRQPAFWHKEGGEWRYRGMFEEIALPLDWPVYVSHAEASAYARWSGKTLPSEAQWQRAAYGEGREGEREFPWGDDARVQGRGNFDFWRWDAAPVNLFAENVSAFGVTGMLGNGWEWCATEFAPFPAFEAFPFYPGYSANFFDGHHFVLKGGSSRTAGPLLRRTFRNWFQPHYPYAYTGFRCVKNAESGRTAC